MNTDRDKSIESEALLILLDREGICALSGSTCLADSDEPSHVIKTMKLDSTASQQMIRFSLSDNNSLEDIRLSLTTIQQVTGVLRNQVGLFVWWRRFLREIVARIFFHFLH